MYIQRSDGVQNPNDDEQKRWRVSFLILENFNQTEQTRDGEESPDVFENFVTSESSDSNHFTALSQCLCRLFIADVLVIFFL